MKIKQAVTLLSSLMLTTSVMAASPDRGRWFDIEVILISQLGDKSSLKEVFADDVILPSFKKPLDLLTPYLTPNISHLKQQLPFCNSTNQPIKYHDTVHVPAIVTIKPLKIIKEETAQTISIADTPAENNTALTDEVLNQEESYQNDDFFDRVLTEKEKLSELALKQASLATINDSSSQTNDIESAISPEQIALVNAAEQEFSPIQFDYSNTQLASNKEHLLCQITKSEFNALAPDKYRYSYLGFAVNEVPSEISANEDLYNQKPYLLNYDSLALNNIVKQLKRSRDFKPLLHIGWRQPVSSRRNAIPVKLFAGDNIQQYYLDQLELYQQQKAQALAQEQSLNNILSNDTNSESASAEQDLSVHNKEKRLTSIINSLTTISNDTPTLISVLEHAPTPLQINDMANNILMFEPPLPPIQPWYLQGFMQIYINSNNRLNIIADFNMLNLTLAEQETIKRRPNAQLDLQTIPFKQHRQVISTEIHYFDHPYLGMIVQIRRHDRPKSPTENSNAHTQ